MLDVGGVAILAARPAEAGARSPRVHLIERILFEGRVPCREVTGIGLDGRF